MTIDTIKYYNEHATEYAGFTYGILPKDQLEQFVAHIPEGGHILDIGCGSGRDSAYFLKYGYKVTMLEPAEAFNEIIFKNTGQYPVNKTVQEIDEEEQYDGIWACASLLHVPEDEQDDVLKRIRKALKPDGIFYCSYKEGEGSSVDDKGRLQVYNNFASLYKLGKLFPSYVTWRTFDAMDENVMWMNALCKKVRNWV